MFPVPVGYHGHAMICTDWEMGQAYRSWRRDYGDQWEEADFNQNGVDRYESSRAICTRSRSSQHQARLDEKRELNLLCRSFYLAGILGRLHQQSRRTLPRLAPLNMRRLVEVKSRTSASVNNVQPSVSRIGRASFADQPRPFAAMS
jgi:hypothetical protein